MSLMMEYSGYTHDSYPVYLHRVYLIEYVSSFLIYGLSYLYFTRGAVRACV